MQLRHLSADSAHLCQVVYSTNMPKERGVLARSFHVRKNYERVLNARSVRNEQNVPNVRSNYDHGSWRSVKSVCIIHSSAPAFKNVCRNVPEVQFVTDEVPSLTSYFQSPIHITATPHDATCCRLVVDNSSRICHELVRTVAASETTDKSSATFS